MSAPGDRPATAPEDVPVRDAATVVLLRDGAAGPEAYLLRRVRGMAFAPGMTVFPGGGVDRRDADADIAWTGPPAAAWAEAFQADEPLARALVCAAVRETFEESGVLLAGPDADRVTDTDGPAWERDRVALERREQSLGELLARRDLVLRADLLRPWARWITPVGEPRRYDARFLVAALPEGQSTRDVTSEADVVEWVRPEDAVVQARTGIRTMMPPTIVTCEEIAEFETVAEVLEAAAGREIAPVRPELGRDGSGVHATLPNGRVISISRPPAPG